MIGYLSGTVKAVHKNYLIIAVDGVGYRVFVTPGLLLSTEAGKPISVFTHTYVREDQLTLYGFSSIAELDLFELLIGVSGVGPKGALSVLSSDDLNNIKTGILSEDITIFTKVSGIGKKTGERLILELKDKIAEDDSDLVGRSSSLGEAEEVMDVLLALGYSRTEARKAIAAIPKGLSEQEDQVREALRSLAKQ